MKNLLTLLLLGLFWNATAQDEQIASMLQKVDQSMRSSENLHLEFTTQVKNLQSGEVEENTTTYWKSGNKIRTKLGSYESVSDGKVQLHIDHDEKKIIANKPAAVESIAEVDFQSSLKFCAKKLLKDTLGQHLIELHFDSSYPISTLFIYLKKDKLTKVVISSRGSTPTLVTVSYDVFDTSPTISSKKFDVKKFINYKNGNMTQTIDYQSYKLYNLLKA